MSSDSERRYSNRLPFKKKVLLCDWIRRNRARIESVKPSFELAATWATAELEFHVSGVAIKSVVEDMPEDFAWPRNLQVINPEGGAHNKLSTNPRYGNLCAMVAKLRKQMDDLRSQLGIDSD